MLYIFSDESGDIYDKNQKYYVRSFVFIKDVVYEEMKNIFANIKTQHSIKEEIKFENFKNVPERYDEILKKDFSIYVCFTDVMENLLQREHEYNLIKDLDELLTQHNKEYLSEKLKNAVRGEYWLDYFEYHYYKYLKNILTTMNSLTFNSFTLCIDKPKFTERQYLNMLSKLNMHSFSRLEDSKESFGIQLADIVAGSVNELLIKRCSTKDNYNNYIHPKLLNGQISGFGRYTRNIPNPNHVLKPRDEKMVEYNNLLKTRYIYVLS